MTILKRISIVLLSIVLFINIIPSSSISAHDNSLPDNINLRWEGQTLCWDRISTIDRIGVFLYPCNEDGTFYQGSIYDERQDNLPSSTTSYDFSDKITSLGYGYYFAIVRAYLTPEDKSGIAYHSDIYHYVNPNNQNDMSNLYYLDMGYPMSINFRWDSLILRWNLPSNSRVMSVSVRPCSSDGVCDYDWLPSVIDYEDQSCDFSSIIEEYGYGSYLADITIDLDYDTTVFDYETYGYYNYGIYTINATFFSEEDIGVSAFVERLYTKALNRPSEIDGKANWSNALMTYQETGGAAARFFCLSEEMSNRNLNNEDYVEMLYNVFFDRASDPVGKSNWVTKLNAGASRESILDGFINSTEWANVCARYGIDSGGTALSNIDPTENVLDFVRRIYDKCLTRGSDAGGLDYWGREISNRRQSATNVAYGFFFSEEFINFNLGNEEYLERLYQTFMDRASDEGGRNYWLERLNSGTTREEVFYGFANSEEFTNICESYGIYN